MELAKGLSRSLGAFAPYSWPVTKMKRAFGMTSTMAGDDGVKGYSALQSGLLRRIFEEVGTFSGQPAVCLFFDLWKF